MIISKATGGYCVIDDYTNFNSFFCCDYAKAFRTSKDIKKEIDRLHDLNRDYNWFWPKEPSKRTKRLVRMFWALKAQGK